MNNPPTLQPLGIFRFMALPPELRRRIYYFAVVEPHPLRLMAYPSCDNPYGYNVKKNLRMFEACREFRTEMSDLLYSENSFSYAIPRHELKKNTKSYRIDLKRVQKCYIPVKDITGPGDSDKEEPFKLLSDTEYFGDFKFFVTRLPSKATS